ncbi:peptidoglycan-binding protein [Candidatus Kaiserbacteria bacterium]|nr:peptidoglycan-binding protein [Candidatus Kaiserbacteria bacterium]
MRTARRVFPGMLFVCAALLVPLVALASSNALRITGYSNIMSDGTGDTVVLFPTPKATDKFDAPVPVFCDHSSGDTYPLGRTAVICTATDTFGNSSTIHFVINVRNVNNPTITVTFTDTGGHDVFATTTVNGADTGPVLYTVVAQDGAQGRIFNQNQISCIPPSGAIFHRDTDGTTITPLICSVSVSGHAVFQETPAVISVENTSVHGLSSCTLDGLTLDDGQSTTFYSSKIVTSVTCSAVAQGRTCTDGVLSGSDSYRYSSCSGPGSLISSGSGGGGGWFFNPFGPYPHPNAGNGLGNGNTSPFTNLLGLGSGNGNTSCLSYEVKQLQIFLNAHGFLIAKTGPGSPGQETGVFGPATVAALIKFQEANAKYILKPLHLKKGTGKLGPGTIKFINKLLGITTAGTPLPASCAPGNSPGSSGTHKNVATTTPQPPAATPPAPKKNGCPKWLCFWR